MPKKPLQKIFVFDWHTITGFAFGESAFDKLSILHHPRSPWACKSRIESLACTHCLCITYNQCHSRHPARLDSPSQHKKHVTSCHIFCNARDCQKFALHVCLWNLSHAPQSLVHTHAKGTINSHQMSILADM